MKLAPVFCRICQNTPTFLCLPLGAQPPANQFLTKKQLSQPEPSFPLNTHVCLECGLIQVPNFIPPNFFRQYVYMPSVSQMLRNHFSGFAQLLTKEYRKSGDDLIVDIGSNDGLFLKACLDRGARVLGIEPSQNLTTIAREKGVEVVNQYFNFDTAQDALKKYGPASIITSTNTFNHIDDLHGFMKGIEVLLDPQGVFVVEVPHSLDLVKENQFDTIYHEHLSEFSVRSLVQLYKHGNLEIFDLKELPIHGGSMRVFAQKKTGPHPKNPIVSEWLKEENEAGLFQRETYERFSERVYQNKTEMMVLLNKLKSEGKTLAGYGAPAKGSTLLNFYGIGSDLLDFLADRNPLKQGLYSPGSHILVVDPKEIEKKKPDYLLILAWNFADEIMQEQAAFKNQGGKFIIPIPSLRII